MDTPSALATFALLTIPIAHNFWAMEEPLKTMKLPRGDGHITVVNRFLIASTN